MSHFKKQIVVNVYSPSGQFLRSLPNFTFKDGFTKELNGGLGECVIQTDMKFDYSGTDLILGNDIEIRIVDKDTTAALNPEGSNSVIVYRGYISLIERDVDGHSESVQIHMLGYYTLLALDFLKNGTQTTLYSNSSTGLTVTVGSQNSTDVALMVRAVIDRYRAETTNPRISYNVADIPLTGVTATYAFEQRMYRDALDDLKGMAPAGIFYYLNEIGKLTFKTKPTAPVHKFVFGRHFTSVHVEHSLEKARNVLLAWNGIPTGGSGPVYKHYEDAASIALYGRRAEADTDYGIDNSDASDLLGARFLADNKKPDLLVTCVIMDNNQDDNFGYDIESIQPGDTCRFEGFASGFDDIFQDNMLITAVTYTLDSAVVTVEIVKSSLSEIQTRQQKKLHEIQSGGTGIPTTYT
jgi:hypothetical protein